MSMRAVVTSIAACVACVASAATYYSTQTNAAGVVNNGAVISAAANLVSATGESPDAATWGLERSDDTVVLGATGEVSRIVKFQVPKTITTPRYLAKVIGDKRIEMELHHLKNGDKYEDAKFVIQDPNDFKGAWRTTLPRGTMVFENDATFTPRLERLETQSYLTLNVTNAAGNVCVGLLRVAKETESRTGGDIIAQTNGNNAAHGWGALEKTGPGMLTVEAADGKNEHIYVRGGTLALKGQAKPTRTLEDILAEAWLHLDPSRVDTLMTYEDAGGRTCVTNWMSVNGTRAAKFPSQTEFDAYWKSDGMTYDSLNPPFIGSARSSSGLPLMDFGSSSQGMVEQTGPLHGIMIFPECQQVREVFYIRCFTQSQSGYAYNSVVGHHTNYPLHTDGLGGLFSTAASTAVRNGIVTVNGVNACWWDYPADAYTRGWGQPFLLNVATTENIKLDLLGSERLMKDRTGGCRLGEVIIFTHTLTEAERHQVNAYLMKKWFKDYQECDVESVSLASGTSISVPAGRVVRIDRLSVAGGSFVKKGDGHLQLGEIEPSTTTIDVQGGSVDVGSGSYIATDDAPASSPMLWLDARDRTSMVLSNDTASGSTFLLRWNDRAGGANYAAPQPIGTITNLPRVVTSSLVAGGADVVDFGTARGAKKDVVAQVGDASYATFDLNGKQPLTAFLVIRFRENLWGNKFDTSSFDLINNAFLSTASLLARDYAVAKCVTAAWTRNGGVENPYVTRSGFTTGASAPFEVLSFVAGEGLPFDMLAADRGMQGFGGKQVAEVILYDRMLSLDERRQTEAYLLKRWKAASHPAAVESTWRSSSSTEPVVIDRDNDVTFATVEGGSRDYVKTGSGAVTIAPTLAVRDDAPSTLSVLHGSLAVNYEYPVKPLFRFDATSSDSFFDTYTSSDRQYVTAWRDADGRAVTANSYIGYQSVTNGYLEAVETAAGVTRTMLNCGNGNAALTSANPSAGYLMSTKFTTVREALAVEADTAESAQALFSANDNSINYLRGWTKARQLIQNYDTSQIMVTNGYIAVDGVEKPYNYVLPAGVHLIHFGPTANTTINTIAHDRHVTAGGLRVGEQVAYAENLTAARRAYMTQGLLYKWFETGSRPVWTNNIANILMENGAVLSLATANDAYGDTVHVVGTWSGWGTIEAADVIALAENGTITVVANRPLTVTGTVNVPTVANVALDASGLSQDFTGGDITVLSATALTGAEDLADWSLTVTGARRRFVWKLVRTPTALVVNATPRGMLLLCR